MAGSSSPGGERPGRAFPACVRVENPCERRAKGRRNASAGPSRRGASAVTLEPMAVLASPRAAGEPVTADSEHPLAPGTAVEVRNHFDGRWARGFEISARPTAGYLVRRCPTGASCPPCSTADEVRLHRERRARHLVVLIAGTGAWSHPPGQAPVRAYPAGVGRSGASWTRPRPDHVDAGRRSRPPAGSDRLGAAAGGPRRHLGHGGGLLRPGGEPGLPCPPGRHGRAPTPCRGCGGVPRDGFGRPRDHRGYAYPFMFGAVATPRMFTDLEPVFTAVHPDVVLHEPASWPPPPQPPPADPPRGGRLRRPRPRGAAGGGRGAPGRPVGHGRPAGCALVRPVRPSLPPPVPTDLSTSVPVGTVRAMRPLAFDGRTDDRAPAWTAPLGSERPCLYVTFGTEFAARAPFPAVLAAVDDLDADVVITVGPRLEPTGLGPVPKNVRVEQYVPQRFVLARSAAVVSHGGSGSGAGRRRARAPPPVPPARRRPVRQRRRRQPLRHGADVGTTRDRREHAAARHRAHRARRRTRGPPLPP